MAFAEVLILNYEDMMRDEEDDEYIYDKDFEDLERETHLCIYIQHQAVQTSVVYFLVS